VTVLIAGAGIAGLSLGLTLHQIGMPFRIFEAVPAIRPLGVGINLQPNAVRELFDLGLEQDLDRIAVRTREYGFYSRFGLEIWTEPRGRFAGYNWPQFSVHRGLLQRLLLDTLIARAGLHCVTTNARARGFENIEDGVLLHFDGAEEPARGNILIAADGIRSAIRSQVYPDEGEPVWGGAILWRGTSLAAPFRGGASMALIGHDTQRLVAYPISQPDPATGNVTMNWIAERRVDPTGGWNRGDWNRTANKADFAAYFDKWKFDWLDIPELIRTAESVFEYPMVDRDPVECWTFGNATLMGDAAHPTYPVGSNGASQAIIDARVLGAKIRQHGMTPKALSEYEAIIRPQTGKVILANRGSGPDAVLQMVEDRCGGLFDDIENIIPHRQLAEHAVRYKKLAGFDIETLNNAPPLLPSLSPL
jgi:2-polyprenyl-6-methoxyphenol hydroxylase-like FAD-dependent oxidoreductase